jgi:hypothetical protein
MMKFLKKKAMAPSPTLFFEKVPISVTAPIKVRLIEEIVDPDIVINPEENSNPRLAIAPDTVTDPAIDLLIALIRLPVGVMVAVRSFLGALRSDPESVTLPEAAIGLIFILEIAPDGVIDPLNSLEVRLISDPTVVIDPKNTLLTFGISVPEVEIDPDSDLMSTFSVASDPDSVTDPENALEIALTRLPIGVEEP